MAEESLREMAGRQFKKFLQKNVNTPLKSIGAGTLVTGILQSSSVVALMTLSFVGAGLINMRNALAITLGANLGTTLDSWVIAAIGFKFDLMMMAFPIVIVAVSVRLIFPKLKLMNQLSMFLIGFSMLFIGLEWMKDSAAYFVQHLDMQKYASHNAYWFVLFGFIITVIIQSSSAITAITLTALYHQIIPFENAIGLLIGSEVGTTIKVYLGSLGGNADKKRVALGNFYFNIVLLIISSSLLYPIADFLYIQIGQYDSLLALVTFQTGINIIIIGLFFPFMGHLGQFLESKYIDIQNLNLTQYIQNTQLTYTEEALPSVKKELLRFLNKTIEFNSVILGVTNGKEEQSWLDKLKNRSELEDTYIGLKQLQGAILEYLVDLRENDNNKEEIEAIGKLIGVTRNIMHAAKKIKDIGHNVLDLEQTADDGLYALLTQIQLDEQTFMDSILLLKDETAHPDLSLKIQKLSENNERLYNMSVNYTLNELDKGTIKELDSSTLLSIYRAIHASHLSILEALEDLNS